MKPLENAKISDNRCYQIHGSRKCLIFALMFNTTTFGSTLYIDRLNVTF